MDKTETDILDSIAKEDGRSRKNLCETEIRKLIKERGQKIKTATKNDDTKMNTENELFGEIHEQEENGLFGNEHRRQYEEEQEALRFAANRSGCL